MPAIWYFPLLTATIGIVAAAAAVADYPALVWHCQRLLHSRLPKVLLTLCISTKLTLTVKSVFAAASILPNISSMTQGMTPWVSTSGDQDDPIV